jgi:cardiolipin synthase
LFAVLSLSDWVDGRLARWLHQRSDFGARLDSFADAALYAGLLGGALLLSWETLQHELVWISIGLGSYVLTTGAGLLKYGRVPSYHTYGAKGTQWLALFAGGFVVLEWTVWPLRLAAIAVTLTNLEATAITCVLNEWRADVLTLFHVWPNDRTPK